VTRHAKASSVGSTQGQGTSLGSFVRGAFPTREASGDANGSGARSTGAAPARPLSVLCLSVAAVLALCASPALAAHTHPYTGTSFGPDGVGGTESFEGARSLAVDPANGDTYVYDAAAGKVYKFDSAGAPLNFSATGTNAISGVGGGGGGAEFEIALAPAGSPSGTAGDIYVANNGQAIHVYSPSGTELGELPQGGETCGVATDPSGNLYAGVYSSTINKFTPSANPPTPGDQSATGTVEQGICNVAADGLGNVYAANYNGNGLYKLEGLTDPTPTLIDSVANTMAIAPGSNDLYANHGNEVFQYDSSGTPIGSFGNGDVSGSHGVAVNSAATKIYVGTPTKVKVFGPATTVPDAITEAADAITKTTATLRGKVGAAGGPDATCVFQYTRASDYGEHGFAGASEAPCNPAGPFSGTATTPVSATATGLSAESAYRFRLLASSSAGSNGGPALSFQTPGAVNVLTDPATNITTSGATLNGTVNPEGTELEECTFEYRTGSGPFEKAPCAESPAAIGSGNTLVPVHLDLTELTGGTEYQFHLVAKNELGTSQGVEMSFKAKGPSLGLVSLKGATENSATFQATINPNGADTSYVFEYVTQADFEQGGFAGAASVPAGGEDIGAGTSDVEVSATAEGLQPRSAYRFRATATNADGTIRSTVKAFATRNTAPVFGSCPNDRFRTGPSAKLPDCRAYEQVTPNDKFGSDAYGSEYGVQGSVSGDGITSYTFSGFPNSSGFQYANVFLSSRAGNGWSTAGLNTPPSYGDTSDVMAWTPDLRLSFARAYDFEGSGAGYKLVMRDSADGSRTVLIPQSAGLNGFTLGGAFDDDSRIIFEADGSVPVTSGPAPVSTEGNVYLYDRDSGELTLVGLLPDSACASPPCVPAEGSKLPAVFETYVQDGHVVSTIGDVYFTDRATGRLYLRRGATTELVSASRKTNGDGPGGVATNSPQPVNFHGATPDGSKAFLTSTEELTNDANTGPEPFVTPAIGRANIDGSGLQHGFISTKAKWTAVDSGYVYWTNTSAGTIGRADIGGANPNPSFITGLANPEGIAVDSGHIYWAEARDHAEGHGTIGRSTLAGAIVEKEFITGINDPHGVGVNSEYIFWTGAYGLGRAEISGGNPELSFISTERPTGIAVNATNVYWAGNGALFETKVGGPNGEGYGYVSVSGEPRGIAIDSNHVYWSDVSTGEIGRRDLNLFEDNPSNANPNFITNVHGVFGLAADAGHIYWASDLSSSGLPANPGNDLYRYDAAAGEFVDLAPDSADPDGAEVLGVLGYSNDGNYVYFAANADLDGSGPALPGDCTERNQGYIHFSGSCSIYLWQDDGAGTCSTAGGCLSFVAPIDAEGGNARSDGLNWAVGNADNMKPSRVSTDGHTLVFRSQAKLTSYDNTPAGEACGEGFTQFPCPEFYRYDAESGQVTCVTCNPTGAPPVGAPDLKNPDMYHAPSSNATFSVQPFLSRNLSADGNRFFFQSTDKLASADVNGETKCDTKDIARLGAGPSCRDVYEWEAPGTPGGSCTTDSGAYSQPNGGCIYLLSTGTGIYPSYLADVSESGDTAFIFSRQKLVPSDEDSQEDIYAVKVDGGLLTQNTPRPANCEGDACRGASSQPSNAPGAGSGVFEGPGNPKQSANQTRCPKGKKTVHTKGKVRCVAKKHKKKAHKHMSKAHKRATNTNRRASR
jgi:hypothetical protein